MPAEGLHIRIRMRDPRQECGCSPWVVMCAHRDGVVVLLSDETLATLSTHSSPKRFVVHGPGVRVLCNCGINHLAFDDFGESSRFDTIEDAQAEFARRAELLRLGEPAHA